MSYVPSSKHTLTYEDADAAEARRQHELQLRIQELSHQNKRLEEQRQQLTSALEDADDEVATNRDNIEAIRRQLAETKRQLEDAQRRNEELEEQLSTIGSASGSASAHAIERDRRIEAWQQEQDQADTHSTSSIGYDDCEQNETDGDEDTSARTSLGRCGESSAAAAGHEAALSEHAFRQAIRVGASSSPIHDRRTSTASTPDGPVLGRDSLDSIDRAQLRSLVVQLAASDDELLSQLFDAANVGEILHRQFGQPGSGGYDSQLNDEEQEQDRSGAVIESDAGADSDTSQGAGVDLLTELSLADVEAANDEEPVTTRVTSDVEARQVSVHVSPVETAQARENKSDASEVADDSVVLASAEDESAPSSHHSSFAMPDSEMSNLSSHRGSYAEIVASPSRKMLLLGPQRSFNAARGRPVPHRQGPSPSTAKSASDSAVQQSDDNSSFISSLVNGMSSLWTATTSHSSSPAAAKSRFHDQAVATSASSAAHDRRGASLLAASEQGSSASIRSTASSQTSHAGDSHSRSQSKRKRRRRKAKKSPGAASDSQATNDTRSSLSAHEQNALAPEQLQNDTEEFHDCREAPESSITTDAVIVLFREERRISKDDLEMWALQQDALRGVSRRDTMARLRKILHDLECQDRLIMDIVDDTKLVFVLR